MASPLKTRLKSLKRKLDWPVSLVSTSAALITVTSFTWSLVQWCRDHDVTVGLRSWLVRIAGTAVPVVLTCIVPVLVWQQRQRRLRSARRRADAALWRALAPLLWVCLLPAGGVDLLLNHHRWWSFSGDPLWARLLIPLSHWPLYLGGLTVQGLVRLGLPVWTSLWSIPASASVAAVSLRAVLTILQTGLLLAWLMRQVHRGKSMTDPACAVTLLVATLNALALCLA